MNRLTIPTRSRRRLALASAFAAGILFAAPGLAAVQALNQDLNFSVSGAPIWAGTAPVFDQNLAQVPVGPSIGPDAILSLGGLDFGVRANFSAGVDVALNTQLHDFHIGTVDATYPISVQLNFPDRVNQGETFTISSSFSVNPGASFNTTSNQAALQLGARAGLFANLTVRACFFGCFIDETFINESVPLGTRPLLTQTNTETTLHIFNEINDVASLFGLTPLANPQIPGSAIEIVPGLPVDRPVDFIIAEASNVSGRIGAPDIVTTGSLQGTSVVGAGTDIFANVDVDLDGFLPIPLGFGPVTVGDLTIGADIFDATLNTQLIERQSFALDTAPMLELDLGPVLGTVSLPLGGSVDLTFPGGVSELTINPTVSLVNNFTNTTTVAAAQATEITIGSLTLNLPAVEVLPGTPDIPIPAIPSFCIIPTPFGCALRFPGTPATSIPGIPPLVFPGVNFDEAIFRETLRDQLLDTTILGQPVDIGTCDLAPQVCNTLPLFGQSGARTVQEFVSSFMLPFQALALNSFSITGIPEPGTLLLLAVGLLAVGLGSQTRRRRFAMVARR